MRLALRMMSVLCVVGAAGVAQGAPPAGRALRVQGNRFVDAAGQPIVFRGVAIGDPDKLASAGHWDRTIFEEIKAWGANVVRVPVHPAAWRARGAKAYLSLLDEGVSWARECGLSVMVDWHVIGSAVVVVAGLDWAYELRDVLADPVDAPAVAYASHPYPQKRDEPWEEKWEADWGHVAAKHPVFVTELGYARDGSVPFVGTNHYGRAIVSFMEKRGMSWAAWCFDPDWGPTLVRDWSFTPTEQGRLWKAAMLGQPLPPE